MDKTSYPLQKPVESPGAPFHLGQQVDPRSLGNPEEFKASLHAPPMIGALHSCTPDAVNPGELHYLEASGNVVCDLQGEWEGFESMMDSGASECVTPPATGAGILVQPSAGSRSGQVCFAANEAKVPNQGDNASRCRMSLGRTSQ